jgi:hypothetical protein
LLVGKKESINTRSRNLLNNVQEEREWSNLT